MRALNVLIDDQLEQITGLVLKFLTSADSSTLIGEKDVPNLKVKNSNEHGWPWQTAHSDLSKIMESIRQL